MFAAMLRSLPAGFIGGTLRGESRAMGYSNKQGAPYSASCIKSMVVGPTLRQLRTSLR